MGRHQKTVTAFHDTGSLCKIIDLGPPPDVQDLTVDPASEPMGRDEEGYARYDASGTLDLKSRFKKLTHLTNDHHGRVWIAMERAFMRMDRTGMILQTSSRLTARIRL